MNSGPHIKAEEDPAGRRPVKRNRLGEELLDDVLAVWAPRAHARRSREFLSVTVASMMFAMPIPPTSSEDAGDHALLSRKLNVARGPLGLTQ